MATDIMIDELLGNVVTHMRITTLINQRLIVFPISVSCVRENSRRRCMCYMRRCYQSYKIFCSIFVVDINENLM